MGSEWDPEIGRRTTLGGIAGFIGSPLISSIGGATGDWRVSSAPTDATGSHHPGPPRFLQVGETIENVPHVGEHGAFDMRDNFAPRIPAPEADGDNYEADAFEWSIVDRPAESEATLQFASTVDPEFPRYDEGTDHTADFEADVPGRYTLALDAPDGTHEWMIHAFPAGDGPPPRISLEASLDADDQTVTIASNPTPAPASAATRDDIDVVFLADDRDGLETASIQTDGSSAQLSLDALQGESARIHACAYDGTARSMMDTIEVHPDGAVSYPNRPPEWAKNAVLYQIFPRSWAGERGETTMADLVDGVDYLDDLGIDVVWLTPVVPAESVTRQLQGELLPEEYQHLADTYSGGGPHGYDTLDYFDIAPDLVPNGHSPRDAYRAFVQACHERDINVVFDVVISHCGRSHPFFQDTIADQGSDPPHPVLEYPAVREWDENSKYFDWFARVDIDDTYEGELVEAAPASTGFFGLRHMPNFNFNNLALREHVLAMADFWSRSQAEGGMGVDGFRCDIAWGVPKSLWQEMRNIVRQNESEFLMLDETIPKDPRMAENAFDMHFDTEGFTVNAHNVATGETSPDQLVDVVQDRANQGVPPHTLVLNMIENHDEHRLLNQAVVNLYDPDHDAITDAAWEEGAHLQRACWATGVLLPGVPAIYYGQERQISRFGVGRHRGGDDHRGRENGGIDVSADVRPGGRQRAFMNWDEYPAAHLEFYKEVIDSYQELDVLKPDATLRGAWAFTTDNILIFGRDASHLDDVDGPERVVAIVNFDTTPAEVEVRPTLGTTDLLSGEELDDQFPARSGRVLEVEDVVVLEAPDLFGVGDDLAAFEPPTGTDHGPGTYEYPTGEAFADGIFDVTDFAVGETPDTVQFHVGIDGDLTNPAGYQAGFTHQHLQIYIRDPTAESGSTTPHEGVGASMAEPFQYTVLADGANGVRLYDREGEQLATGSVVVNSVSNELLIEIPTAALPIDLEAVELAPLMLGFDPDAPGNVRRVTETPTQTEFGGAEHDDAPNVIDTGLPATFPNETVLDSSPDEPATIPFAAVETEFESVATFDVPTGVEYGPGTYEVPTGDDYFEQAWDLDELQILESRDDVKFEFMMATEPENPWGFDTGFSHPFFQVYLHVPGGDNGSTSGREGTNVAFREPYHYRVVVHGEGLEQIETADGETVSTAVDVDTDGRTITIEFPRAAVDWDIEDTGVAVAPTVMPFDGFGEGDLRGIGTDPAEHLIGGGHADDIDPAVMDMVVPDGMARPAILSDYDGESQPQLPYVGLGPVEDIVGTDGEDEPEEPDDDEPTAESDDADDDGPGFGVAGAVAGIGGTAYLLSQRFAGETGADEPSQ